MAIPEGRSASYRFDRMGWLEKTGYTHRKVLFLDLNFWIQLSQARQPEQEELKRLVSDGVKSGKLICPVSPSILMELGKQHPRSTVRERTIRLMDDFSQGLSVRTIPNVFACEFESVLNGLQPNRLDAYSQFVDAYMESNLKLEVPGTYPENLSGLAANMVFGYMSEMSIAQFMNQWLEDSLSPATSTIQQGFMEKAIEEHDWRRRNQVPLKQIEESEFAAMVQTLLPQIWSVLRAADPRLIQKMQGEEIQILECCPTFWCGYKLMAALRSNQPVKGNDIWDFLHVASAAPYVDCLACDKGTRHICSNLLGMDSKYGTCILSSEKDLTKWVLDL